MDALSITPIIFIKALSFLSSNPIPHRPTTLKPPITDRRPKPLEQSCCDAHNLFDQIPDHSENENGYLQSGGLGTALLSVTSTATVKISPFVATLAANPTFVSGLVAWAVAQWMKVFLNFFVEKKWKLGILFESGGMPSSHSALCTALTTSVALCHGVADSLFPVALGFSLIVMYDAAGVRRHAGMQAQVLNMIVEDMFQGHPISKRKLKELLGHTVSQVIAGALLGVLVACFICQGYLSAP
ncbi:hypothetical protein QQ045_008153 [Rhodiola kirilowii]